MNKHFKSHLLLALLASGLATTHQADAGWSFHAQTNDNSLLWGLGIAAGITAGIAAACNVFSWSDEDILKWVKEGVDECDTKYQQLNNYNGHIISKLQLFGNRNKATWNICSTEADEVTYDNPHFVPLHNTLLIIKGDIKDLLNYNSYLVSRNLTQTQRGRAYYQKIAAIIANLEQFQDVILSSPDYTHEEHVLQPKIHQLRQERLERERNAALREQARAQYDQAQAIREQTEAQREQARKDSYNNERERNRIRREQEQLREEQERIQRDHDRLRREQELQRSNLREQERIRKEQDKLRKEQEKLRREQERLQRLQEKQAREQQNSDGPAACNVIVYNDSFPVLLDY